MFFVISGFVVCGSICTQVHTHAPDAAQLLVGFYARRAKRLTPALVATLAATSLAVALLFSPQANLDGYVTTMQIALLGNTNNLFARRGDSSAALIRTPAYNSTRSCTRGPSAWKV
jgi:peptidoglycan/LPS O-acetylase OafA/YrhL